MIQAYTTTAVINYSISAPENPATPYLFMPNHDGPREMDQQAAIPEQRAEAHQEFQQRALQLAAEIKQGFGPLYEEICRARL